MLQDLTLALALIAASPESSSTAPRAGRDSLVVAPAAAVDSSAGGLRNAMGRVLEPDSTAAVIRQVDYLWVLRGALVSRASIDSVVARAAAMGVRGLLVQVVGRGDAFYRSRILPRAEAIPRGAGPDFDPLAVLLERSRAAGLEVHAWINSMLVWSGPRLPRNPDHVVNAHPEWVARLADGRPMTRLDAGTRKRMGVEGVFLSPAHPGVRTWLARVAQEIAAGYAVDGIHLDYIRQPDVGIGYDPTTRARFALENGVDPARFSRVPPGEQAAIVAAWVAFQQDQVTAAVREVRDSVEAVRPGVVLSAAVIADIARAERWNAQPWRSWVRDGVVDRVYLMCYAPEVQRVMDQLVAFREQLGADDRVVPGLAVFNASASAVALKIKGARALGYPWIALYSYDSLFSTPEQWSALQTCLSPTVRRND